MRLKVYDLAKFGFGHGRNCATGVRVDFVVADDVAILAGVLRAGGARERLGCVGEAPSSYLRDTSTFGEKHCFRQLLHYRGGFTSNRRRALAISDLL